jgi:hypothetical protein
MLAKAVVNILTVLFPGVELCNAIYVLYSVFVPTLTVTLALLLAVPVIPLGEWVHFISKVKFALGLPLCSVERNHSSG